MKIAVIGAGLSGASVVKTILSHPNFKNKDQIDIFEPRDTLGVGMPYEADGKSAMLNVSPDVLSVDATDSKDFSKWLEEHYDEPTNFEGLVSRPQYGQYLTERFAPYFSDKRVSHIQSTVVDIAVLDANTKQRIFEQNGADYVYQVKTTTGWHNEIYDGLFFSVGHPPYADYYNLVGTKNYIHNPYPLQEKLSTISENQKVGVIGSGASAIDLMRYFGNNFDLEVPLTFYVQDEIFNFPEIPYEENSIIFSFSHNWIAQEKEKHDGFIPLKVIIDTFTEDIRNNGFNLHEVYNRYKVDHLPSMRKAIETNDQGLALIQRYSGVLVEFLPALFNALSGEDKDEYLKNYHHKLLFFKAHVPNKSFRWLLDLLDAGKLRIVMGLTEIIPNDDGSFKMIADKEETADILINATGFNTVLKDAAKHVPLIKNLYNQKIILPHENGRFVLVDWPNLNVMNQRYGLMKNLFFFGILIGGTQHENNDAQLTIQQGSFSANAFMDNYR